MTTKAEFRESYPTGMLAVPLEEVVRMHASSGTSGKPTIGAYTAADVRLFAEMNARAIALAGATSESLVHIAYGYGLFTGGLGLHYGVEALGATAIPASGGNSGFQVQMLADLGATGLACTPSYSLLLAERAAEEGLLESISLQWGIHGAEPWSEGMRQKIEDAWGGGFSACDIYGLTEIIGPGWRPNGATTRAAWSSWKTISIRRSSIPTPGEVWRTESRGSCAHHSHQTGPAGDPVPDG